MLITKRLFSLMIFPVTALIGPRQVGKTTLAKEIMKIYTKKAVYLDLELPSDINKLNEAEIYLKQYENCLVIIDEIQKMPELFPLLRSLVDQNRIPGRFLLLGSASPDLIRNSSETLAGRVVYKELTPFLINELVDHKNHVNDLWLKGGYPESYQHDHKNSITWRESFIRTYLERDIPQLGIQIPARKLRNFWTMLAHLNGQLWNASSISKNLGVTSPTAQRYLDILSNTFVIRILQPYFTNIKKRLIKSPKIYIRDTGLLHSLLSIHSFDALLGHPSIGNSWEGFVIEQIISSGPYNWNYFFFRTSAGAEIDLLCLPPGEKPIAVEVKFSSAPKVSKGFWNAYHDLECQKGFVIYLGNDNYPIKNNVYVTSLDNFTNIFSD